MQIQLFQFSQESQLGWDGAVQKSICEIQEFEDGERPNGCWNRSTEAVVTQIHCYQTWGEDVDDRTNVSIQLVEVEDNNRHLLTLAEFCRDRTFQ